MKQVSPKRLLRNDPALAQRWRDVTESEDFQRVWQAALLEYQLSLQSPAQVGEAVGATQNWFRVDGARGFVAILATIADDSETPARPSVPSLNYNPDALKRPEQKKE